MAEGVSRYNPEKKNVGREIAGTGIEAAGVVFSAAELYSRAILGVFAGAAIWIIGRWVKYAGTDSRSNQTGGAVH